MGHGALHGPARARNVVLVDDGDTLIVGARRGRDTLGLVVNHHGERVGIECRYGIHHTVQKSLSRQGVQHLRLAGTHTGALTRGEDDCGA